MSVKVVNIKKESCDIPVCRPTIFGNFMGFGNPRKNAVEAFALYFYSEDGRKLREKALKEIPENAKIGCYCSPEPCHADIIAGYLNWKRSLQFFCYALRG
jgi:hypothetical protein